MFLREVVPCPPRTDRGHCRARAKFTWRQLAGLLKRAAEGQKDVSEVSVALKIVLQIEGVTCR